MTYFPMGATDASSIKALQTAVNRFSNDPSYGFSPIAVDGIVGKQTTAALIMALDIARGSEAVVDANTRAIASSLFDRINVPADIGTGELATTTLNQAADQLHYNPVIAPATQVASVTTRPGAVVPEMTKSKVAGATGLAASVGLPIPNWMLFAGGGVAVAALILLKGKKKGRR